MRPHELAQDLDIGWYPERYLEVAAYEAVSSAIEDHEAVPELNFHWEGEEKRYLTPFAECLGTFEHRLRLAVLIAFLDERRLGRFRSWEHALLDHPRLPIKLVRVGVAEPDVSVVLDADQVAEWLDVRVKPSLRRLSIALATIFCVENVTVHVNDVTAGVNAPPVPALPTVYQEVPAVCGTLPKGAELRLSYRGVGLSMRSET